MADAQLQEHYPGKFTGKYKNEVEEMRLNSPQTTTYNQPPPPQPPNIGPWILICVMILAALGAYLGPKYIDSLKEEPTTEIIDNTVNTTKGWIIEAGD